MNVKVSLALLAAILLSVSMMASIELPKAESTSPNYSVVQIISPSDMTYSTRVLTLNATFPCGMGMQYTLKYSLDGGAEKSLPWTVTKADEAHVIHDAFGVLELPPLSNGVHSVVVILVASGFLNGENPRKYTDQVGFTIAADDSTQSNSISSPFLFQDIVAEVRPMSPWDNANYTGQVPLNITVRFSARSSLPNQHLIPYENISCIYQLDGGAWQNASLSSTSDQNAWHDPTFQGYWNQQDCNYTAVLQGLSNGEHALNVSLTPKLQYCYRYTDNGLELIYNVGEDAYDINADAA